LETVPALVACGRHPSDGARLMTMLALLSAVKAVVALSARQDGRAFPD
jgi:hypothetical protein